MRIFKTENGWSAFNTGSFRSFSCPTLRPAEISIISKIVFSIFLDSDFHKTEFQLYVSQKILADGDMSRRATVNDVVIQRELSMMNPS